MKRARKKKRFIASLMALALIAAVPGDMRSMVSVHAEEGTESSTEKVQLDKPTAWFSDTDKYAMYYGGRNESIDSDYNMTRWNIEVYKDEQLFESGTWYEDYYEGVWDSDKQQWVDTDTPATQFSIGAWLEFRIFESGTYKFRAQAQAAPGDEKYRDSEWSEWSEGISYVRPEQELGVVAKATWEEEKAGTCHFIALDDSQNLHHYKIAIYTPLSDGTYHEIDSKWVYAYDCRGQAVIDVDFSDVISRYGERKYYVTVQAFSNDIDTVAHGKVSDPSYILDTSMNAEKLSRLLRDAADKTAVETKELLTSSADISAVQQAMQTDDTFREQIQTLESRYAQEQNINVEPPAVSETAKEYVDPSQVSVVGAALNAAQGKAVNLQMDVTPEEERVYSAYKKNVQLDIKLVSDDEDVHELDVPVSVTMPIPQGINEAQLVLLHHRADGMTERISVHINGDGTITFTVTSFSTFVFAEESSGDEPEPAEPKPEEQVRNFVSRMYTVALGRNAEEQGLKDWTERLLAHDVDGAGIAHGFIMSDEFKNRNLSNEEFVDVLYRTFFNREADAGGRANWLAELAEGKARGYVLSGFVNSEEFDKLCDNYGIARGTMRENGTPCNPGIRNFVERCYTKVLSRDGEKAGIEDWTSRIITGQMSAEDVAKSFFFSDEYTNKDTSNEVFVETLYQAFMDRSSDEAGKSDWVGRLNGGTSRQEVLEGFSRSVEFAQILQSYGL